MILLLDMGNTRLKWGLCPSGRGALGVPGGWLARGGLPSAEVERLTDALAGPLAGQAPEWIGVSCVAADGPRDRLADVLRDLGEAVHWLRAEADRHGLRNLYDPPDRLGADRYAMLVAALRGDLAPCVVVGAGTALTVDALDAGGDFRGGLILPGAALMRRALGEGTAGVSELTGQARDFPRRTGDAVETGIRAAMAGAVEYLRGRLARPDGGPVRVLLTGGDAALLAGLVAEPLVRVEDLVLEGLRWIAWEGLGQA